MSPHETSSNVEDMHTLLQELNSLNELHAPDRCDAGIFSMGKAAFGFGDTGVTQKKWLAATDENKRKIMKSVIDDVATWIGLASTNIDEVINVKDGLYHVKRIEPVWKTEVDKY